MVPPWVLLFLGGAAAASLLLAGGFVASRIFGAREALLALRLGQAEAEAQEARAQVEKITEAANEALENEEKLDRLARLSPTERLAGLLGPSSLGGEGPETDPPSAPS